MFVCVALGPEFNDVYVCMSAAASWVDDSDGLPDWPMAPQSGEYTEEELLESYVSCLCYCRVSDRHCRLFLVRYHAATPTHAADANFTSQHWFSVEQAAEEYHHHDDDDDGALLAYQLLAFAVVLSYSTAEEYYRLAHVLLPRMIEADLLRFQLPTALPLPLAATAVERTWTHDTTRHDTTRHDTTRHDTTRHDTNWHSGS
jgi:hypothetical protein